MFVDEWFEKGFYKKLPLGYHSKFCFGQIFFAFAHYVPPHMQLWRPVVDPADPTKTMATTFNMVGLQQDAFKRKFPLHAPELKTTEEFVVVKAKRRPVVLLQTEPPLGDLGQKQSLKFGRNRVTVGQVFSVADRVTGKQKYDPGLVARVRTLEFPQLFFLPSGAALPVDSVLRLDELQTIPVPGLEPTPHCIADELQEILKSQIQFLMTGLPGEYTDLRELLINDTNSAV